MLGDWDTSRVTCCSKSIHGFHAGSMPLVANCEIFNRRLFEGKNLQGSSAKIGEMQNINFICPDTQILHESVGNLIP